MSDTHPPRETWKSVWIHVIAPATIAAVAASASLAMDLVGNEGFWFQRLGAVMAAVGGYIAFHESRQSIRTFELGEGHGSLYLDLHIRYKWLALAYAIAGTAIWGYGDLPFKD